MPKATFVTTVLAVALLGSGCGGGGSDNTTTTAKSAKGAVTTLNNVKKATVQITTEGELRDPKEGTTGVAGAGSGFIISPDGTIVTNNHVVTGAGSVKVRVAGSDEEIPAKVIGVSECNDLAVIKLTDPGPYPYLQWSTKKVEPPLEVYTAGFPLGDPEYTVTKGVVSKAKADGNTSWASVRHVIEHDANIQPGNSGGPLVDKTGRVVGVNYASGPGAGDTSQYFAIANDLVKPQVALLKKGDQDSIGVNGEAIQDEEAQLAGIWVNGVDAGGPADKVGIKPGDIITNLNGVELNSGTKKEYCDVLRTANAKEAMSVRVLRFDTSEELAGEINGKELAQTYSFADKLGGDVSSSGSGEAYDYTAIADDTGRMATVVPTAWSDHKTTPEDVVGTGTPQPQIQASESLSGFNSNTSPGVAIVLIDGVTGVDPQTILTKAVEGSGCTESSRDTYETDAFTGPFAVTKCGDFVGVILTATSKANPSTLVLSVGLAKTDNDLAAIDQALTNLQIK